MVRRVSPDLFQKAAAARRYSGCRNPLRIPHGAGEP
ncbi:MAG: hypothetical protein EA376_10445 [Phycisphaeraceae bacterium]|nr:MAG: hypothetical protein EA376_10445 [Phycisphaeraceae bacterium]